MKGFSYVAPSARAPVADPMFYRPDWTASFSRDPNLLWLDKNENIDPEFSKLAVRILSEIDPAAIYSYPDCANLYHKLAGQLGVNADNLLLAAGSDGAIRAVFEAFVNHGDVVVHTDPTFAMYSVYSKMYGAKAALLKYHATDSGPRLLVGEVIDTIKKVRPKLVCLPNPDSPTGTIFSPSDMRQIIEASGEAKALILIDEAYHPFYEQTVVPWIDEYKHLVIARTFAKAWGVAGLRIGYAVSCREIAICLHKVRPMYEVNTLAVAVMEKLLDHQDEMMACVERLEKGKRFFLEEMSRMGFYVLHGKGNFLHVAFGDHAEAIHSALSRIVYYRKNFNEPCLRGFSRFSSTTAERFRPVVDSIAKIVS